MAKVCEICGKKALTSNQRSHSNIASKRKMGVNLQNKKMGGQKMSVCTSCIKTYNKLHREAAA